MTSVSKHLQPLKEVNVGHGEDRISSLPDSLLIYILSFIPTKFAFRTTILSKRWKDLWAFVPNLDFDGSMLDAPMQTPDYDKSFMNFVTKVFFFHRSPCIKRFHLKDGGGIDVSRVHTWISVLTARGVEEVNIEMYTRQDLILPQKLFCCKTLVVLKLINELKFNFPTSVYLSNLKILHVSLHYPENDITQKLFTSCPMLEDLHLRANVVDESEMIFDVSSPALKKLKFHLITFLECEHFDRGMKLSKNKIVVNAPVLEHLTVRDDYLPCNSLNNLSLLVRAYINVGHCCIELLGTKEHANKLFMLLEGITSAKFLSLAAASMGALEFADDYKLPLYPNLTNLELAVHNNYSWRRLPDSLDCVPKLKTLTLLKDPSCDKNGAKYDFDWIELLREMPSCFSFLEEIRFSGFKGDDDEFKLLKYFLENTEALNMIIMERKRKPDHPRRMMSDVLHNRTSVAPPSEEASHRPASEGPLVPPPSEGPLVPPYRPPSVAPLQLPCTQPPRRPSVRPPSVAPLQLSSSAYEPSADPSTSSQPTSGHVSSSSTSTRRGRGCAKGIKEWGTGKKLDIQFDGNYCPIGDNVAKLTTQLGIIVRNGNIVPLTFLDWNNVPDDIVDAIWKDVKDNLNICPEEYKPICMKNCNSIWKDHKNKLKAKYFKPRSSDPNLKDDVPMNVVPSQWEQLVEYWRTSDAEKIASRNAKNRRAHGIAHTTGHTTFSQIRHEMTSKGESTDKMNVWLMTRRVDDPEVIQTLDEFNRQLSMLPEDGRTLEARNAIFHELIGHDGHGYCRTYGRIVPRRAVYKDGVGPSQSTPQPSTIDQITQKVRTELRDELREELRAEFSKHLQQMRAEMMALVSQGASVDPNRQAFRESAEDENPYTPPPEAQIFPE